MKILYGVQGTGNGHISRSRVMAEELKKAGHEVQFLFSGRPKEKFFDIEMFGNPIFKKGLTFSIENGKVNLLKTVFCNEYSTFLKDIDYLDLSGYDLIISDYEPITAWAARAQKKFCLGIGHQYAFDYNIPKSHNNFITDLIMKWFAPVSKGIGLHWYHFDQPIFPPIFEPLEEKTSIPDEILVYLPFESPETIINLLIWFQKYNFIVYGHKDIKNPVEAPNITFFNPSKDGFRSHLQTCSGVICNAGFELASEAMSLGKKVFVKPVHGQMEQHSNAKALIYLNYASYGQTLLSQQIDAFLHKPTAMKISYPNVAAYIVEHLDKLDTLNYREVWNCVHVKNISV